ncbi:MAG: nucleotidyl transferase AbiEii/AbiGii toxin family protein [Chloroflexota bacterium]|nr:nucleotidyl transferase AbiEii/AbiGii toxin family protein [Chloroflexota bacterium]
MKAYIEHLLKDAVDSVTGRNLLREYLQARILEILQRCGAMVPLAFHGGTSLRFLYAIPRYSEDLDFALENTGGGYKFRNYLRAIQDEFTKEGYEVAVRLNDQKTVNAAFVRFNHLLYEFGLSPQRDEVLAVKIEVDTNPPEGAGIETTIVRRHVTLRLQHHDRASLLAGKLHAVLQRPYVKGRDMYDLMWYLSDPDWPAPYLVLLQNALRQTGWEGEMPDENNWRRLLSERLSGIDWMESAADVRPFLERGNEIDLLTRENFKKLLEKGSENSS